MKIITEILTNFKILKNKIIYGPTEIPVNSHLYGKKLYKHGCYKRKLIISDEIQVIIVIFRFCEKINGKYKTYSLLPFYISPYQRYINTYIDRVIQLFFFEYKSVEKISEETGIGIATVRRWISKFIEKAENINTKTEIMMIDSKPGYRAASSSNKDKNNLVKGIFKKVFQLTKNKMILFEYGVISWINLKIS